MTRWVLDTNVYIRASRHRDARAAFDAFFADHLAHTDFAATVWMELQMGARTRGEQGGLDELVEVVGGQDAVLAPSAEAFRQAGRVLRDLSTSEGLELERVRPLFHHDVLLACTVREYQRTLVTYNADDFTRIERHLRGFRFVLPFPR
jgi:predicted nucleic acid-binding protein